MDRAILLFRCQAHVVDYGGYDNSGLANADDPIPIFVISPIRDGHAAHGLLSRELIRADHGTTEIAPNISLAWARQWKPKRPALGKVKVTEPGRSSPPVKERSFAYDAASGVDEPAKGTSISAESKDSCVLLVDDDASTRQLVARWLTGAGIPSKQASSGPEGIALATEHPEEFAAIVLDIMMPGMDGFEVAARLKANAATAILPVVVLTAHAMTDDDIVKGIDFGAVDHMAKPFSGPVLVAKIRSAIARTQRERAIMAKLDSAESHARVDALTGLFNRRHFVLRLREECAHAVRHRRPFSVVMFDIDHFKSINDSFGHDEGDRVLVFVAATALHVLRLGDQAFRYGGEEFMLLLRECDAAMATCVAERLRSELRAHPVVLSNQERIVTFSAGVAAADSTNDYSSPDIVSNADAALYRAKGAGRDCVKIF